MRRMPAPQVTVRGAPSPRRAPSRDDAYPRRKAPENAAARFERDALPHLPRLFAAALTMTGSAADAESIENEVFVKAFDSYHRTPHEIVHLRLELYRILVTQLSSLVTELSAADRAKRPPRSPSCAAPDREGIPDRTPTPTQPDVWSAETLLELPDSDVRAAMRAIPPPHRIALYLAGVEDFSHEEIAQITGQSVATVRSGLRSGLDHLRAELGAAAALTHHGL